MQNLTHPNGSRVRKCIIPVAGFGTRFLPATKALPKEMLPVLDKPVVQCIVEEAVASGIEDIILVTGQNKRAVEDHFDFHSELEDWLKKTKKFQQLEQIREIAKMANFIYIRQKGPYGNGTPILNARHLIGNEPFAVLWGDEMFVSKKPRLKQLIETYEKYHDSVLCAMKITKEETSKYGVIEGLQVEKGVLQVKNLKEKPGPDKTKSRIGSLSGYILTPEIFEHLGKTPLRNNELWLVDGIERMMKKRSVYARLVEGERYDAGSKFGWLKANIATALQNKGMKNKLKSYLREAL